jgi:hypothetical protein
MKQFFNTLFLMQIVINMIPLLAEEINSKKPLFDITATYDHINSSKFHSSHEHKKHALSFEESNLLATCTQELTLNNGLKYGIGYANTRLDYNHYIDINQKTFNNLLLNFGGYTKDIDDWKIKAEVYMQVNTNHLISSRYAFFRGFMRGAYDWKKDLKLHIGIEGTTGMHYTHVWPSIGFEWAQSERLRINAVFPSNISAVYALTHHFSVSGSMHYFLTRQRLGEDEHRRLKRGLIAYRNAGLELGLNYNIAERFLANIHIGYALAGRLHINNHRNDQHNCHKLKNAPYFGGVINYVF